MLDELYPSSVAWWGVAAALVGFALGFLPTGRLRLYLITAWALVPLWLMTSIVAVDWSVSRAWLFGLVLVLLSLPPWAVLSLVPFSLVRWVRGRYGRKAD
jgi:hypothetical protein